MANLQSYKNEYEYGIAKLEPTLLNVLNSSTPEFPTLDVFEEGDHLVTVSEYMSTASEEVVLDVVRDPHMGVKTFVLTVKYSEPLMAGDDALLPDA